MDNYDERHDKIVVHLRELYKSHKTLDNSIKECYNKFERDEVIVRLKTQKLWIKDEIHRLEHELKAIK
jgi:hypothetical protein